MTIMRGDSYPIYIELLQDDTILIPEMVAEIEVCIGESMRKLYSRNEVMFDQSSGRWYIRLSQEETLAWTESAYNVIVRIKYANMDYPDVLGLKVGRINVVDTFSKEAI